MNLFDRLPFVDNPDADLVDEETGRKGVPTQGPTKYRTISNGQIRRERKRALERQTKRARRAQIRDFQARETEAATLRGHLQAAGVIAYTTPGHTATPDQARRSVIWIVQRYAEGDETGAVKVTREVVVGALQAALNRYQNLTGQAQTLLSPAYVLPVRLA